MRNVGACPNAACVARERSTFPSFFGIGFRRVRVLPGAQPEGRIGHEVVRFAGDGTREPLRPSGKKPEGLAPFDEALRLPAHGAPRRRKRKRLKRSQTRSRRLAIGSIESTKLGRCRRVFSRPESRSQLPATEYPACTSTTGDRRTAGPLPEYARRSSSS